MIHSINYARQVISAKIGSGINWLAPPENRIISPLTSIIKSAIKFFGHFTEIYNVELKIYFEDMFIG